MQQCLFIGIVVWYSYAAEGESLQRFIKDFEALDPEKCEDTSKSTTCIVGKKIWKVTYFCKFVCDNDVKRLQTRFLIYMFFIDSAFQSLSAIIGIYTYILTHGESREDQAFNDMVALFTSVWMEREKKEQWVRQECVAWFFCF